MRIISTDNYGGDYPDEKDVVTGIASRETADFICDALNNNAVCPDNRYFVVVADDYQLKPGFEP